MPNDVQKITRKKWVNRFHIVGRPHITDFTFKIDEESQRSSYVYSTMNLGIDCGEKYGTCYAEMIGGYSPERPMPIRVHGKDNKGNDDFKHQFTVEWDEREDEDVLDQIGRQCFIVVGLEKRTNGKNFNKRFLSAYDAIAYIKDNLSEDMVVTVTGDITYNEYNGVVRMRKNINGIFLSSIDDPSKFHATFVQSVIIDNDSADMKETDKSTGIMPVNGIVLDYLKEFNGHEIRGQWPYRFNFEWKYDLSRPEVCKKMHNFLFKKKKGYLKQVTFEGDLISSGATVNATWDDVSDDMKMLVDCGYYTEEEALANCAANGPREQHVVLRRPASFNNVVQVFDDLYEDDELDVSWAYVGMDEDKDDDDNPFGESESVFTEDGTTGDDDDWLNMLE